MRDNTASENGGAMSVGLVATVSISESTAKGNMAVGGSGGMLHLSGVKAATLEGIDAVGNAAGSTGGAVAAFDSTRTTIMLMNSTVRGHKAGESGGGIFLDDSAMGLVGVLLSENSAEAGDGGAVATTGTATFLEVSDTDCTNVDVLVDWSTAGNGCPVAYDGRYTCDPLIFNFEMTCAELENLAFIGEGKCSGCPCNDRYVYRALVPPLQDRVFDPHLLRVLLRRERGVYEKYFVITQHGEDSDTTTVEYETSTSVDVNNDMLRGLPSAGSLAKFSFCCLPGEYTMHAIDTASTGWWGGAYSVLADGVTVIQEEMNRTSSSRQSTPFTVMLSPSARTNVSSNKALQGGGGAMFWNDVPLERVERYRERARESNVALYGAFIATPARNLTTMHDSYHAYSGRAMSAGPITVELKDE